MFTGNFEVCLFIFKKIFEFLRSKCSGPNVISLYSTESGKMESEFEVCVIGAGLFGSACAKYVAESGSKTILVGPKEESREQVLHSIFNKKVQQLEYRYQFQQHILSSFCTNIFCQKITKPSCKKKLLVKCRKN